MNSKTKVGAAALAICVVGLVHPTTANADTPDPSAVASASPVESTQANSAAITAARAEALDARESGNESEALEELREELEDSGAMNGATYLDTDVESFEVAPGVLMAVPEDVDVTSVTVDAANPDKISAQVGTNLEGEQTQEINSQGMAYWSTGTSDTYILKITGAGEMESKWAKRRLIGDNSSTYNYWSYRRVGLGRSYEIPYRNYAVTGLTISSSPGPNTMDIIAERVDQRPASDFNGQCNGGTYNIGVDVFGVGAGGAFQDCDKYDVVARADNPGYYRVGMSQGINFTQGDREVGWQIAVKVRGTSHPAWNDYQTLEMARVIYPASTCHSADSSKTCSP